MQINEYLKHNKMITDGAMGTYFELKHPEENGIAESANLSVPEKIEQIHLEYLEAGAQLIRTNTFAANSLFFDEMEQVLAIVRSGYQIARKAVAKSGKQAWVAADIGPIHDAGYLGEEVILEEYKQICDAFLEEGAEIFLFETQSEATYIAAVSAYLKQRKPDAFVMVQFSFDQTGYTKLGLSVRKMLEQVAMLDTVDAYGFNCGMEAAHLLQLLAKLSFPNGKFVSALPNAGYPIELRGKTFYTGNKSYFVDKMKQISALGMDILGGCCGTTPDYIRSLAEQTELENRVPKKIGQPHSERKKRETLDFARKLSAGEKLYVVELDPPFGIEIEKVIEGAGILKNSGADLLTLSDSPLAKTRMDSGHLAAKVQRETGIPVMPHICCRDRNVIAMRGGMLGNYIEDLRHYLFVTGDPVGRESEGQIKPVFDFNSIRLMQYVSAMNEEVFQEEPVLFGGALNYHGANPDAIIRRMEKKREAGCSFFLSQPVYSEEDIDRIRYIRERTSAKILCGIMPLVSYKNAVFLNNVMPGINIPEEIIQRYHPDMTREEGEQIAIEISLELSAKLKDISDGYYFMTPFNRASLIAEILKEIRKAEKS